MDKVYNTTETASATVYHARLYFVSIKYKFYPTCVQTHIPHNIPT